MASNLYTPDNTELFVRLFRGELGRTEISRLLRIEKSRVDEFYGISPSQDGMLRWLERNRPDLVEPYEAAFTIVSLSGDGYMPF